MEAALVGPPVVADHREPVSPANPYYLKDMPIPARGVAKAKALLAGASAPKPQVAFMVPNGSEALQVAQVVQAMPPRLALTYASRRPSSPHHWSSPQREISMPI